MILRRSASGQLLLDVVMVCHSIVVERWDFVQSGMHGSMT